MSKKREHYPEQDQAESDASERRLTNDANDRDESPPSGSSRSASVRDRGDVSDFLADEIGALDSMRHGDSSEVDNSRSDGTVARGSQDAEPGKVAPSDPPE